MRVSVRHAASLLFVLIALLAAVWGIQRAMGEGEGVRALVIAEPDLDARIVRGLSSNTSFVCAYDPDAGFGAMLSPGEVRAWRAALGTGPYGTLDLPMAALWTLFSAIGLAATGHALAIGGLSLLNPRFVAIAWWALLPEMFLADGGWFGALSPARLWSTLGTIGVVARLRPWGRRSSVCASESATPRRRLLTKKTVVAGGVCWLTAFGVFAAVYPSLTPDRAKADAAAGASSAVRQARGQGDFVAENMGRGGIAAAAPDTTPQIAAAPPPPAAPPAAEGSASESASADSGPALPRFAGPSAGKAAGSGRTASSSQQTATAPTTSPTTPTTEMALAGSAPTLPPLSSPWMQMQISDVIGTRPSTPAAPQAGGGPAQQPQDEPEVGLPEVPVTPIDGRAPIVDLPAKPDAPLQEPGPTGPKDPLDPTPAGPGPTPLPEGPTPPSPGPTPDDGPIPDAGQGVVPTPVPEPGMLGLFAVGLIGMVRLRRR